MKSRCGFLRDDITRRARESFPDQFQIISDPENYKFYSKVIQDDVPRQLEILHVGIYDQHIKNSGRRALYAFADAQEVSYFHGRKGERIFPLVDELFPDAGCIRFKDGQGPFQFLRSQNRTNKSAEKTEIRKSLRTGLDTLVKFAFLYAGRRSLTADHRDEFLVQLERVCRLLEQSQTDCKEKLCNRGMVPKRVDLDNDSEASDSLQPSSTIPSPLEKRVPIKGFSSNAGLNFGRTAVEADQRTAYQQGKFVYILISHLYSQFMLPGRRGTIGTTVPPPQAGKGIARKVIPNGHKRANPVMEEMSNENGRGRGKFTLGLWMMCL